jgi:hypothetical protein
MEGFFPTYTTSCGKQRCFSQDMRGNYLGVAGVTGVQEPSARLGRKIAAFGGNAGRRRENRIQNSGDAGSFQLGGTDNVFNRPSGFGAAAGGTANQALAPRIPYSILFSVFRLLLQLLNSCNSCGASPPHPLNNVPSFAPMDREAAAMVNPRKIMAQTPRAAAR